MYFVFTSYYIHYTRIVRINIENTSYLVRWLNGYIVTLASRVLDLYDKLIL